MREIKQVILCGFGGQGIVLAGTILGQAAFNDRKWVSGTNSYGAAARGGTCRAEVVISDRRITFPHVIGADILIAMHQAAYDKYIVEVKGEEGVVIYDEWFAPKETEGLKYVPIPATRIAIEELNNEIIANVIILSAAVEMTKITTNDALIAAIEETVGKRFKDLNLKAADTGFRLGKMRGWHGSTRPNTETSNRQRKM